MDWNETRVLITGGGGYIASHLIEEMLKRGAHIRALVKYNSRSDIGNLEYVGKNPNLEIVHGDLRDPFKVKAALEDIEFVFHLAASISIPYSYESPGDVLLNNVQSTLNVLENVRNADVTGLVHTSSSEVYGTAEYVPIDAKHPLKAQSPYAASKIACDKLVESYVCSYDINATTVRPFNTFGPRQSTRAVIPAISVQALSRKRIFIGDKRPTRDFVYVKDTVKGFVLAGERMKKVKGKIVVLATGEEITIGDLAKKIVMLANSKSELVFDAQRVRPAQSEVQRLCGDSSLARKELGWKPGYSLDQGLKATIEWLGDYLHKYNPDIYAV